jgi:hypothetical protein
MNFYVVAGILVLAVAYGTLRTRPDSVSMPMILINSAILLAAILVCGAIVAVLVAFVLAAIMTVRLSKDQSVIAYRLDNAGLTMSDLNGSAGTTPWNVVKRAREDSRAFCFRLKPAGARYVPKRAFAPADIVAIRALLTEKLGKAAKLKT